MELKVFRDTLCAAGAGCTVKAEIPIETEILISDYLPQVFKIVKCFARPVVLQKQLQPGRLTLEGYIRCTVYYQGEEGAGLCQTESKLPFSKAIEMPMAEFSSWSATVEGETEYLNCRAVNPRRIEVRGAYALVASVHTQCRTDVITALADCGIEQQQVSIAGARRAAVLDKLITAEGEMKFETPPAAILDITGTASLRELKLLSGKAVAKGEINALCAWKVMGTDQLKSQSLTLPFNQILDVDGLSEDCHCLCVAEPVGFALAQGEGDGAAHLTVTALLHLRAWRDYELQVVADAFSTQNETQNEVQQLASESLACTFDETTVISGAGALPDENTRLLACFAAFGPAQIEVKDNASVLTAKVIVTAFGQNSLDEIDSYEKTLELVMPLASCACSEGKDAEFYPECWLSAEDIHAECKGGTLEVTLTVRAQGAVLCQQNTACIRSIEIGDALVSADPEISLRIYYAQQGEELFAIARQFHVSVEQMAAANAIENETAVLDEPRRLLVPGA